MNQGCEGHNCTIMIPSVSSCIHFWISICIMLNGGKTYTNSCPQSYMKLSMKTAPGSGSQAQNRGTWWLSLDANKWISGSPKNTQTACKRSIFNDHSVWPSNSQDAWSAKMLEDPGQWAVLSHNFFVNGKQPNFLCNPIACLRFCGPLFVNTCYSRCVVCHNCNMLISQITAKAPQAKIYGFQFKSIGMHLLFCISPSTPSFTLRLSHSIHSVVY